MQVIHKGAKLNRPPDVQRHGQGMKDAYGLVCRMIEAGDDLIMERETRTTRKSAIVVAVNESAGKVRELARCFWQDDDEVFTLQKWEPLVEMSALPRKALDAMMAP